MTKRLRTEMIALCCLLLAGCSLIKNPPPAPRTLAQSIAYANATITDIAATVTTLNLQGVVSTANAQIIAGMLDDASASVDKASAALRRGDAATAQSNLGAAEYTLTQAKDRATRAGKVP